MDMYKVVGKIGEGAHGVVLRGRHLVSGQDVALKKVRIKKFEDGVPNSILREIKALRHPNSQYILKLLDAFPEGLGFVLVFEYMPSGLWEMLSDALNPLTMPQVKTYAMMLLKGVAYLHGCSIMHRDLKPANLLVSKEGILKIADLGQARLFWENEARPYSHQVATRWYRAPELLYGSRDYTPAVDLWAVGCIVAEMHNRHPLFPGETDIEQLAMVVRTLGTPTEELWPGLTKLPDYNKITFPHSVGVSWSKIMSNTCPETINLVKRFLVYSADHRLSANEALVHPYFFTQPLPCPLFSMPKPVDGHRQMSKRTEYDVDMPVEHVLQALKNLMTESPDNHQ